jgi:hypothetical protein
MTSRTVERPRVDRGALGERVKRVRVALPDELTSRSSRRHARRLRAPCATTRALRFEQLIDVCRRRLPDYGERRVADARRPLVRASARREAQFRAFQVKGRWPHALRGGLPPAVGRAQPRLRVRVPICRTSRPSSMPSLVGDLAGRPTGSSARRSTCSASVRRPPGPAPHPHRLRLHRPSVPQGFPADRQRRSALRRRRRARRLRAGQSIEPRVLVPRVIRDDARYEQASPKPAQACRQLSGDPRCQRSAT